MKRREIIYDADDLDFETNMKNILLYHKVIKVEVLNDQEAQLILDNGVILETAGNEGCGGCNNGWYYLKQLNKCDNAITNVECTIDSDEWGDDIYTIFVYAEDVRIPLLSYEGGDNGYYGTGYTVTVRKKS